MKARIWALAALASLAMICQAPAQKFEDFKPGHTFPRQGYAPDPDKVVYVLLWHHKKRVTEFGYQDFFMNADGVNNTTADKMKRLMEERYPNLTIYVKETNERDVRTMVQRERKRIKFIEKDWVDVKQPEKIEPPKRLADRAIGYGYDRNAPKAFVDPAVGLWERSEGQTWTFQADHSIIVRWDSKTTKGRWRRHGDKLTGTVDWFYGDERKSLDFDAVLNKDRIDGYFGSSRLKLTKKSDVPF